MSRFFLSILSVACWLTAACVCAQPASVNGPTVKVGDTWMYNTLNGWTGELSYVSVNNVADIARDAIRMESRTLAGELTAKVTRTPGFNLMRIEAANFTQRATPHYPNYAFPLHVGKTWKQSVDLGNTQALGNEVKASLEGRVVGWETVTEIGRAHV